MYIYILFGRQFQHIFNKFFSLILISIIEIMMEKGEDKGGYVGYIKDSDYYFDSYSHFSIHEEMLKDSIRTKAYMNAIMKNGHLFKDKIVLDVGSGTGILSIFAAQSGAKHVYGIEKANIYIHSRNIIQENGLTDKITIINGLVEEVVLPVEKVDIIISQWMGYFLLYESMLDSVLFARDKWLNPDGMIFPDKAIMYLAAIDDEHYYNKKINYWDNVYGVSMKCIQNWVLSQPIIDIIEKHDILTDNCAFYEINIQKVTKQDLDFHSKFQLNGVYKGKIFGLLNWFDCVFSHGTKQLILSTSPFRKPTHWKQCVFYLDKPIEVVDGTKIQGSIDVKKAKSNVRQLQVCVSYSVDKIQYPKQYYRIS